MCVIKVIINKSVVKFLYLKKNQGMKTALIFKMLWNSKFI